MIDLETAFIGRTAEMADLVGAVDDVVRGQGRVVLVGGEPGIGKTTLARRVAAYARERGLDVSWCRSREGEPAPPYWPWIELLRAGGLDLAREPLAAALLNQSGPATGVPSARPEDRLVLFDRFTARLTEVARERPLLLVFDDLHGADRSSLLLLQFVIQRIAAAPILLLALYRDIDVGRQHPLSPFLAEVVREPGVWRLSLRGLDADEVRRFLEVASGEAPPAALVDAVLRRSGGNPFFVKELVRLAVNVVPGNTRPLIPESVREVIGHRLDGLSTECDRMLSLAAVIGPEFSLGVLERLMDLARQPLLELLDEAVRARLVSETTPHSGRYAFAHALFRDTLYAEIPTTRRIGLHRRVGEILEDLYGPNLDDHLPELAFHFGEAAAGGEASKAIAYALRAGHRAAATTAYEEAARCYESALESLELVSDRDDGTRCDALLGLSEMLWRSGSFRRARSTALRAFETARAIGSASQLGRAALNVCGRSLVFDANPDREVVGVLEEALQATGEREPALTTLLSAQLAREVTSAATPEKLRALADDAIARARNTGDPAVLASVLRSTYWPLWAERPPEKRLLVAREIVDLADGVGDRALALEGHVYAFLGHVEVGDRAAAVAELETCTRTAERLHQRHLLWLVTLVRGCWASGQGELEEFERLSKEALSLGQEDQNPAALFFYGFQFAFLATAHGRFAEAEQMLLAHAGTFPLVMDSYRAFLAVLYAIAGRRTEARDEFERFAADGFVGLRQGILWTGIVTNLANACALLGDAPRAAELYTRLAPLAGQLMAPIVACLGSVDRYLGQLAATMGRWADAERHFEVAIDMNRRMHHWLQLAFTQAEYAQMLIARGAPADQEKIGLLVTEAWAFMERVGMGNLLAGVQTTQANGGEPHAESPSGTDARSANECLFHKEGEFWSVAYQGQVARLRHRKGFEYLAQLLRSPEQEFAALDLALGNGNTPAGTRSHRATDGVTSTPAVAFGDAGPALDRTARDQFRRRRAAIQAELAEAERINDTLRASRLEEEAALLAEQLASAIGLGGRRRASGSATERSRSTVTKGIRGAIRAIQRVDSALGRYLAAHVRTGSLCVYIPDLRHPVVFKPDQR